MMTNLRTGVLNARWLVEDRPGEAEEAARAAISGWSQKGFQLQHYYDMAARAQIALYVGDARRAHREVEERWPALWRSGMLRGQLIFIGAHELRARAALAAAEGTGTRKALLDAAARDVKAILGRRAPWGVPVAALLRAGIAASSGDRGTAMRELACAERGFVEADMGLYAAAARRRWGQLAGGEHGKALADAAAQWMIGRGIEAPDRMTAMLAPGFG
jgi:hypothetical protein